jgi:hypothetical protein
VVETVVVDPGTQGVLYPFDPRFGTSPLQGPEFLASEENLYHDAVGYIFRVEALQNWVPLRWSGVAEPGIPSADRVSIFSMPDGSWAVNAVTPAAYSDGGAVGTVYWFYPFHCRVHYWQVTQAGERIRGHDLTLAEAWDFCFDRRSDGIQYFVRLLMIAAAADQSFALSLLMAEIQEDMLTKSPELAYFIVQHGLPAEYERIAVDKLKKFIADAVDRPEPERNLRSFEARVRPVIDILEQGPKPQSYLIPNIPNIGLLHELRAHAPWSRAGQRPLCNPLPVVTAVGRGAIPALSGTFLELSFQLRLCLDVRERLRLQFEIPIDSPEWMPRLIHGIAIIDEIAIHLREDARWRVIARECGTDFHEESVVYGQTTDNAIALDRCVSFERRQGECSLTLLPDPYFYSSLGYHELRLAISRDRLRWRDREPVAFWRGSTTGLLDGQPSIQRHNMTELLRLRLCELGLGETRMDFGITGIVQAEPEVADALRNLCEQKGILKPFVPIEQMAPYKLLVDIDGNANSWGLFAKFLLGSCVLKVESVWEEWFYQKLVPWRHYVPVSADLSDLREKVQWCLDNDQEAEAIGEAGARLAAGMTLETETAAAARRLLRCLAGRGNPPILVTA